MPKADHTSRGRDLAQRLRAGCALAGHAPTPGARDLPVKTGLTPKCLFLEPLENVRDRATRLLLVSERVYLYGDDGVLEAIVGSDRRDGTRARHRAQEIGADAHNANRLV